jgi:rhamnose transport system substrate-binding protein
MIKKSVLWIIVMVLAATMVATFLLSGCAAEEVAEEAEEVAEEVEEVAEEVEEEVEEVAEEVEEETEEVPESPWYKGEGPYVLAWVPKGLGHPYFITCYEGAQEAAAEFGDEIFEVGPDDWSVEGQISVVESVIDQGVDAIGIAANDKDALAPVCKKAMDAGIPVIAWDAEVSADARVSFVNQASFEGIGRTLAQLMGETLNYEGNIAILSATPQAPNQRKWVDWIYEELKDPKYANMTVVDTVFGDDLPEKSYEKTLGLLKAYPELKGIIGMTATATPAAAQAIMDEGAKDSVKLVGFGIPSTMEEYVLTGNCEKFILWNTVDLGYVAATAMHKTCSGEFTGQPGEKIVLGRPTDANPEGVYEVILSDEDEPFILLGPPMVFDESNIAEWADKL